MISFNSVGFYVLVLLFFLLYQNLRTPRRRKVALSAFNLLMLSMILFFDKRRAVSLLGFVAFTYLALAGVSISNRWRRTGGWIVVFCSILFLFFFKYSAFQSLSIAIFPGLNSWPLGLIGVSFFTFRLLSLIFDFMVDQDFKLDALHFFNYLLFFPCYLSGPLDRYSRFRNDCETGQPLTSIQTYSAVNRILIGCFKKIVIADLLHPFSLDAISSMDVAHLSLGQNLLALYSYIFVLYFDFSGYSDIAIGISSLFGVKTPENFNRPLLATNIQELWNRWHITLMDWMRDYLFYPVLVNLSRRRVGNNTMNTCLALLITFLVAGVWHGDGMNFVFFGLYHGVLFCVWYIYRRLLEARLSKEQLDRYQKNIGVRIAATFLTFSLYTFGFAFFLDQTVWFKMVWKGLVGQ